MSGEAPMTLCERIDKIDRMLFDASVLVLNATTNTKRLAADHKITDARIELEKLRSRVEFR